MSNHAADPLVSSMDTLTPTQRSERMSRVRSKDTKPELAVRKALRSLAFRYRIHMPGLPGKPDIAIPKLRKAVFVHGCFWHVHLGCPRARTPKSPETRPFWVAKLEGNVLRDRRNRRELLKLGWKTLVIWECQTENADRLTNRLRRFLLC